MSPFKISSQGKWLVSGSHRVATIWTILKSSSLLHYCIRVKRPKTSRVQDVILCFSSDLALEVISERGGVGISSWGWLGLPGLSCHPPTLTHPAPLPPPTQTNPQTTNLVTHSRDGCSPVQKARWQVKSQPSPTTKIALLSLNLLIVLELQNPNLLCVSVYSY